MAKPFVKLPGVINRGGNAYAPVAAAGRGGARPGAQPLLNRQQIDLLQQLQALEDRRGGETDAYGSAIYRAQKEKLVSQLAGPVKKPGPVVQKPPPPAAPLAPPAPVAPTIAQVAPQASPVFAPLPPDPITQAAQIVEPVAPISQPEQQVAVAKTEEEMRLEKIEAAKAVEMKRQEEIKRRRGTGIMSFITGGLRGLPSPLAQVLGI